MILPAGCRPLAANFRAGGILFNGGVEEATADVGAGRVVSSSFREVGSSATPGDVGEGRTVAVEVGGTGRGSCSPAMERMACAAWGMGRRVVRVRRGNHDRALSGDEKVRDCRFYISTL